MKIRFRLGTIVVVTLIGFCTLAIFRFAVQHGRQNSLMRRSEKIASKIESFRLEHQKLPSTLEEVEKEENEIFYQREGETNYVLWFGKELGESTVYYSSNKTWRR